LRETSQQASGQGRFSPFVLISICLVSALYFVDIFFRARVKCFWYDELVTVYLCRLPNLSSTLTAVKQGVDLNPPPVLHAHSWRTASLWGGVDRDEAPGNRRVLSILPLPLPFRLEKDGSHCRISCGSLSILHNGAILRL
jgi:hypothetical protein